MWWIVFFSEGFSFQKMDHQNHSVYILAAIDIHFVIYNVNCDMKHISALVHIDFDHET